jgi:hypothetical protein
VTRTRAELREQFEIEREFAAKLRSANSREERRFGGRWLGVASLQCARRLRSGAAAASPDPGGRCDRRGSQP